MKAFWEAIDAQIAKLRVAKSADEVVAICPPVAELSVGDGFFEGGGGDETVLAALHDAGWRIVDRRADYHWCMEAPDGTLITYVEGDLYVGNNMPRSA